MIRLTLHQIWNQRRKNFWIWLELGVLSAFLWLAIDPFFTMLCIRYIPSGFDRDNVYLVQPVYRYIPGTANAENDPNFVPRMDYLLTQLEAYPMVEAVALGNVGLIPGGDIWNADRVYRDTVNSKIRTEIVDGKTIISGVNCQIFSIPHITGLEKWTDVPFALGLRDAISGEYIHSRPDAVAQGMRYVSANLAMNLYGTLQAKDSTVVNNLRFITSTDQAFEGNNPHRIDAVHANVKACDYETPAPCMFKVMNCDKTPFFDFGALVRLKDGTDGEQFMQQVRQDVLRKCRIDPILFFEVSSLKQLVDTNMEKQGANNVVRLQAALGFFGLLCVFLGVSGLFWVRCGERRQDIGVMRSLGATRRMVNRQMLLEGTILLSAAFLPAMMSMAWHVHANGYCIGLNNNFINTYGSDMSYWFNRPVPHLLAVTLLAYASMLLITLLATWLPVHRATRILPSDALRDE